MLKSLVLPELRDRVSDVLDEDVDHFISFVGPLTEHGLGLSSSILNTR